MHRFSGLLGWLAVTAAATLLAGLIAAIGPSLQATRGSLTASLAEARPGISSRRSRARTLLTIAQAAMSVMLLVGAGLFVRSLRELRGLDLGLDVDRLLLARLELMNSALPGEVPGQDIDAAEQNNIFAKLDELALDNDAKAFVIDELRRPLDIDAVVKGATSPERAVEIYAASVLAIDPDDPAEQAYLAMLASRLKLDPALKASVETEARKLPAGT